MSIQETTPFWKMRALSPLIACALALLFSGCDDGGTPFGDAGLGGSGGGPLDAGGSGGGGGSGGEVDAAGGSGGLDGAVGGAVGGADALPPDATIDGGDALPDALPDSALPPDATIDAGRPCAATGVVDYFAEAEPVEGAEQSWRLEGLYNQPGEVEAGCANGAAGGDRVHRFQAPAEGVWVFDLEVPAPSVDDDPVLHARAACDDLGSELACNDDRADGDLSSRLRLALDLGEVIWLVADTFDEEGPANPTYTLLARRLPVIPVGEACDPTGISDVCVAGAVCFPGADEAGRCVEPVPPEIDGLTAARDGARLILRVEGRDANSDAQFVELELLDGQGEALVIDEGSGATRVRFLEPVEPIFGAAAFTAEVSIEELGAFGGAEGVRVWLLDALDLASEPGVEAPIEALAMVDPGAACDPLGIRDRCPEGQGCDRGAEARAGVCRQGASPIIEAAQAAFNLAGLSLGIEIGGTDPNDDVAAFTIQLLDGEGTPLPIITPDGAALEIPFQTLEQGDGRFLGRFSGLLEADAVQPFEQVRLTVVDATGRESEPFLVAPEAPAAIEAGADCDPVGAFNLCEAGSFCIDLDPLNPPGDQCVVPDAACPPAFGALSLNDFPDGEGWLVRGDTTNAESHAIGTCGGGSGDLVFAFTAPAAARYRFATGAGDQMGFDTLLFVRQFCGIGQDLVPESELGCNDDDPAGGDFSVVELQLEAAQTVYVFVDGYFGFQPAQGDFELRATALP